MERRSRVILIVCAVLLLLITLTLCFPVSRKIDTTLIATEYRFNDPDDAVEHTVTIRGCDTRNLLGRGTFILSAAGRPPRQAGRPMPNFPSLPTAISI